MPDRVTISAATAVVIVVLACLFFPSFVGITFVIKDNVMSTNNVIDILAPAFIAALFIERAVEIFVVSIRKNRREIYEVELSDVNVKLDQLKGTGEITNNEEIAKCTIEKEALEKKLKFYKRETTKLSTFFSIIFSFLIAVTGIRLLAPFFEIDFIDCLSGINITPEDCPSGIDNLAESYDWFVRLDIFISTFVIAGGAAGMHSIVDAITSFADKTKETNQN